MNYKFHEVSDSPVAKIDKNGLVSVDWAEVESNVKKYMDGDTNTNYAWCFVLWNVRNGHFRNLND